MNVKRPKEKNFLLSGSTPLVGLAVTMLLMFAGCTKSPEAPPPPTSEAPAAALASPEAGASASPAASPAAAGSPAASPATATPASQAAARNVDLSTDPSGISKATVVMKTGKGTIKFKLYPNDAPNTVKRFVELVQDKFYNGLTFHRVVPGFLVQAGDPRSKAKSGDATTFNGGSGQKIKGEFNGRKHVRGTVGMARPTSDQDGADSQFYVTTGTDLHNYNHLNSTYAVFGQVVDFGEKVGDKDVLDRLRVWDEIVEMHIE